MSISKSSIKATDCEYYYTGYYLERAIQVVSGFTQTGTEFHRYRSEYVEHLIYAGIDKDPKWAHGWLATNPISDEGRDLIEQDILGFYINPEIVYGTEVFFCLDSSLNPIACPKPAPGQQPADSRAYVHGTIDRIDLDGEVAWVHDYKTGWVIRPDEREAAVYALLVLCSLPHVQEVKFFWDFKRSIPIKSSYSRAEDFSYLRGAVMRYHEMEAGLARKKTAGEEPAVNPFSGLCTYCDLMCPIRKGAAYQFPIQPLQATEDAIAAAGYLRAAKRTVGAVEKMVKEWIKERGPVRCPNGVEAKISIGSSLQVNLGGFLELMGIEVDPGDLNLGLGPHLEDLRVGLTELKKLFRRNRDLETALEEHFERKPYSRLSVSAADDEEAEESSS